VLWFRRGKRVLTIGSVHLDTIALSSSPSPHDDVTHVGKITHSVGGSAYNVAANLASHHGKAIRQVAVYTILPQHSVLTEIIKYKIDAAGINSGFVRLYREFSGRHVRGGGYVGILDNERLIRHAVVDAAMHEANIFLDRQEAARLEAAIDWADALVIDSDLAVSTVNHIADHARDNDKPLFVCIGSPLAGRRGWIDTHDTNLATCVSGRLRVLCVILEQLRLAPSELASFRAFVERGDEAAKFDVDEICRLLKTRHVVCGNVRQSQGFALLAAGKPPYRCFFATPEAVRSRVQQGNSAGVVDGALAGFIQSYMHLARRGNAASGALVTDTTRRLFNTNITDLVEHVSESEGATPGSVISFEEEARQQSALAKLWRLTKIAVDVLPVFRYVLSIGALIVALWLIENVIGLIEYLGYQIPLLDKTWLRMLLRR
jgi:sugar/nucleoside kinase (ribokinase family)